jgi:TonB family protein
MKRACIVLLFALTSAISLFGSDTIPAPEKADLPTYPTEARDARIEGVVKVSFVVDGKGNVTRAEVMSGNPLLRNSALQNVKSWKFASEMIGPTKKYETEFIYRLEVQKNPGPPKLLVSFKEGRVEITSELYVKPIE